MIQAANGSIPWLRAVAVTAAGCCAVIATHLPHGISASLAIVLVALITLPLLVARDTLVIAALLPLIALPGSEPWLALGCAAAAGLSLALWWGRERDHDTQQALLPQRIAIDHAARQAEVMERHLDKYPQLQELCLEIGGLRTPDALAEAMRRLCGELVPDLVDVQIWIGNRHDGLRYRAGSTTGTQEPQRNADLVAFVGRQWRPYIHRKGHLNAVLLPLGAPLDERAGKHQIGGILAVEFESRGLEDQLLIEIIEALAQIGGVGLSSLAIMDEARSLALEDDLTGLFGQHEFLRRLDEQASTVRRRDDALGIIMCDLDHLKHYNDAWGHAAGDTALCAVADAIRSVVPEQAVACRYGGEEFAILIPFTRGGQVRRIADELHAAIRSTQPDPDHPDRTVTASLGWAVLGDHESSWEVMRRADEACYHAKDLGRDQVVAAPAPDTSVDHVELIDREDD